METVKDMEANARLQSIAIPNMSRALSMVYAREERKRQDIRPSQSPRKNRRRETSDESDSFLNHFQYFPVALCIYSLSITFNPFTRCL